MSDWQSNVSANGAICSSLETSGDIDPTYLSSVGLPHLTSSTVVIATGNSGSRATETDVS